MSITLITPMYQLKTILFHWQSHGNLYELDGGCGYYTTYCSACCRTIVTKLYLQELTLHLTSKFLIIVFIRKEDFLETVKRRAGACLLLIYYDGKINYAWLFLRDPPLMMIINLATFITLVFSLSWMIIWMITVFTISRLIDSPIIWTFS